MIDIIIPAWNCSGTLKAALDSVVNQNTDNIKIIVVDDNNSSNDIEQICNSCPLSVQYIRNGENKGCGGSRQIGYENSNSEYVYFLDADDIMIPGIIKEFENSIHGEDYLYSGFLQELPSGELFKIHRPRQCWVHGMFYRRAFLDRYGIKFYHGHSHAEDAEFNVMVQELATSSCVIDFPAVIWKNNLLSLTRSSSNWNGESFDDFVNGMTFSYEHILNYKNFDECMLPTQLMTYIAYLYREIGKPNDIPCMENLIKLYQMGFRAINAFWFTDMIRRRASNVAVDR